MKILLLVLAALEPQIEAPTQVETPTQIEALTQIEAPSRLYRALGFGVFITKAGDFASTEYVLSRGGVEKNPFMQRRDVRVAVTALLPFALNWSTEAVRKDGHPKIALWMRIGLVVAHGYLIQHNLRVAF